MNQPVIAKNLGLTIPLTSAPHPEDDAVDGLRQRVWRDGVRPESVAVVAKRYQELARSFPREP